MGQLLQHGPTIDRSSLNLISVLPSSSSVLSNGIQKGLGDLVRIENCIYREQFAEPASSYIIMSEASGSRTIVNYNELPEMSHAEFMSAVEPVRGATDVPWFHFEVCEIRRQRPRGCLGYRALADMGLGSYAELDA